MLLRGFTQDVALSIGPQSFTFTSQMCEGLKMSVQTEFADQYPRLVDQLLDMTTN